MAETMFGLQFAKLRKKKNITQEQIAAYLGVSPQAISKWENGSYPNGDLLPRIADYFGVSIDYLYGREKKEVSLEQQILESVKLSEEKDGSNYEARFEHIFRYIWAMQLSFWANGQCYSERKREEKYPITVSSVTNQSGFSFMRLNKDLEYYAVMKEPEGGFSSYFQVNDRLAELFAFLGKKENLKVLFFVLSLETTECMGAATIARRLKLPEECVKKALEYLSGVQGKDGEGMLGELKLVDEHDRQEKAYIRREASSAVMLLLLAAAESILNSANNYSLQVDGRVKGWLDRNS